MLDLRRLVATSTIAVAVLATAGVAQAAVPKKLTVHVHTQPAVFARDGKVLAEQPAKPRLGDLLYQAATILKGGKKIGRQDTWCGFTGPTLEVCTTVDRLPGGTVVHMGSFDGNNPLFIDAIVGGTGRYAGISGTTEARFTGPLDATQTYHFMR